MQDKIMELLKSEDRAFKLDEVKDYLNINEVEEYKEMYESLASLEKDLKVTRTNKGNYMLFNNPNIKIGIVSTNKKGYGFVRVVGSDDVFIPEKFMNNATHGDTVIIEVTAVTDKGSEGKILQVRERNIKELVGEYQLLENGLGYIKLDDEKIKLDIYITKENSLSAMDGHKVLVSLSHQRKDNSYDGKILRIIGHKNDPGVDISSIVAKMGIRDSFNDEVIKEVDELPDSVLEKDMINRRDLRNEIIFTIDGDDTKDIDDAISIKKLENGNYELGVHIADVSYYVQENTEIDKEAYLRGTSVYLIDRVIPMLPHKLSNGICSLNPNVDRLAISCVMEINDRGETLSADIFPSIIKSRKQMTYKNVNQILEENIVPDDYKEYQDKLLLMHDLAKKLRTYKEKRGYIDFSSSEIKILVDEKSVPIKIEKRIQRSGELLIEDFMIAANEAVAETISNMSLPFIYRVHGTPDAEKILTLTNFLRILGHDVPKKLNFTYPKSMQKLVLELKDSIDYKVVSKQILRSMKKAFYSEINIGHYGLASRDYTHFTSPIRRYPDTTVHRLLRKYLFEHKIDNNTIEYYNRILPSLGEHTSEMEVKADECEREVDSMKMAEYMTNHIGEKFSGMISSVLNFGFFVELDNLVEGLVHIDTLNNFIYDETNFMLKNNKTKKIYRLGDRVDVICTNASKENRTIDFIIDDGRTYQENNKTKRKVYGNSKQKSKL